MRTLLRKILRDFQQRRLRNALTILGVLLGVTGVVAMSLTVRETAEAQRLTSSSARQADLAVFARGLSSTTLNLVSRQPNVVAAETRSVLFTRFSTGEGWFDIRLTGVDNLTGRTLDVIELVEGTAPGAGEIALDRSTQELTSVRIGSTVALREAPGSEITYLTISGFTRTAGTLGAGLQNRATGYTTTRDAQQMAGLSGDNYLLVQVQDAQRASQTSGDLGRLLSKRGVSLGRWDVRDPNTFVGARELDTLLFLLQAFSWGGALLASVIVANTVVAVVNEESHQIGILKSIGAQRWQIGSAYLLYAILLGVVGTLLGFLAGVIAGRNLSAYLVSLTGLQQPPLSITVRELLLAAACGIGMTLGAVAVPVWRRAGGPAAPLLSAPGIRNDRGPAMRLRRLSGASVNVVLTLGVRNARRRPLRSLSTLIVVAVAVATLLATHALSASVNGTVDRLYDLYGADAWITYQRPVDVRFARQLEQIDGVEQAEAWTGGTASIGSTRTDVWGMPSVNPLYGYRLTEGRWFQQSNPPEIVLTSNLAATLDATLEETLELDMNGHVRNVHVVGIVNDSSTYLGNTATGKVFMRMEDVSALRGLGTRADVFAVKLASSDPAQVDVILERIEEQTRDYSPTTLAAYVDQRSARQAINVLTRLLQLMVFAVAATGVAGIANTLLVAITERRREFGVLRTLGARSWHIVTIVVTEGLLLALIGGLCGLALGYPVAQLAVAATGAQLFALDFVIHPWSVASALGLGLAIVGVTAAIPGAIAADVRPTQVLRYE